MYLSNLTPLFVPPVRRQFQQQPADRETQAPVQEPIYDTAPKRPTDAKATAARIVEMGRVRRGEIPYSGMEPTLPMAKKIVAAAAMVRAGDPPAPLPTHPVALAIVLSARKGRGEISTKQDAWLTDYLTTLEVLR